MDRIRTPFAPGAGTPPPELAGRDESRETMRIALERVRRDLPAKSVLMVGFRGVGKTVLLDRMREDAEAARIQTIRIEAPESRSLPAILAPQLRQALLRLSRDEAAKDLARLALRGLVGFAKALKVKYGDIEVGVDAEPAAPPPAPPTGTRPCTVDPTEPAPRKLNQPKTWRMTGCPCW